MKQLKKNIFLKYKIIYKLLYIIFFVLFFFIIALINSYISDINVSYQFFLLPIFIGSVIGFLFVKINDKLYKRIYYDSKKILETVLDAIPVRVFWKDKELKYLGCNQKFAEDAGFSKPEEIIGLSDQQLPLLSKEKASFYKQADLDILQQKKPSLQIIEKIEKQDTIQYIETRKIAIKDDNNEIMGVLGVFDDISDYIQVYQQLERNTKEQRTILENIGLGILFLINRKFIKVNQKFEEIMGYKEHEVLGKTTEIIHESKEKYIEFRENYYKYLISNKPVVAEWQMKRKNGEIIWCQLTGKAINPKNIEAGGMIWILEDISDKKEIELALIESEKRYRIITENTNDIIWTMDMKGKITYVTPSVKTLLGYTATEYIKLPNEKKYPQETIQLMYKNIFKSFRDLRRKKIDPKTFLLTSEYEFIKKDQSTVWVEVKANWLINDQDEVIGIHGVTRDISERKLSEETLEYLAFHDSLTGLYNRQYFQEKYPKILQENLNKNKIVALFFLDLNRFKIINDSLGHDIGDLVLKVTAARFQGIAPKNWLINRWGGDEFTILVFDLDSTDEIQNHAETILTVFENEYKIEDHEFFVNTSIGIAIHPIDTRDDKELIRFADQAMFVAKQRGLKYSYYHDIKSDKSVEWLSIETSLRKAIEGNEFFLVYQPQYDVNTKKISGVEALIRWSNEDKIISPDKFIHIAEETGLIVPIGYWVLKTACEQMKFWHDSGLLNVPISINVSSVQFSSESFIRDIQDILQKTKLDASMLELEITENILMQDIDRSLEKMKFLKNKGVLFAIDDFGTGYSSLTYLKKFPVKKLKIDKSFIQDIETNPDDAQLTLSILQIGHNLDLEIVAEGVENKNQFEFLKEYDCDIIQGYYFNRPLEAEKLTKILKKQL